MIRASSRFESWGKLGNVRFPAQEEVLSPFVFGAAIILAAAQAAPSVTDPLLPARSGQQQCYAPDTARKTCRAMAQYKFSNDNKVESISQVLVSKNGPVVMMSAAPVTVRAGAVCGTLRAEDVRSAGFLVAGQPAPDVLADQIRNQLIPAMSRDFGKEVCTTYVPSDTGYTTKVTISGVAHPEVVDKVIWVGTNDGYVVAP
jgi:hypothetical protein